MGIRGIRIKEGYLEKNFINNIEYYNDFYFIADNALCR